MQENNLGWQIIVNPKKQTSLASFFLREVILVIKLGKKKFLRNFQYNKQMKISDFRNKA